MKTILIPTDFTPCADKAVEFGIEIARRSGARLLLANSFFIPVLDINVPPTMMEAMYESETKNSEDKLKELAGKITRLKDHSGQPLSCTWVSEQSLPDIEIEKLAEKEKVDLVIMGTKGKENFLGMWGSITAGTVKKLQSPILIVKENSSLTDFPVIEFALENVRNEMHAIKELVKFARLFDSEIILIHVEKHARTAKDLERIYEANEDIQSFLESIREYCKYQKIYHTSVLDEDTAEGLLKYLKGSHADMLALLKYERNWIESIFHKSVIKNLIGESTRPLYIIPKAN